MNTLLVDHSNTLISSLHVHKNLHFGEFFTGGVYGYISQLSSVIRKYKINKVVICKDKRPYIRAQMYPLYKADRKQDNGKDDNSMFLDSVALANEFLEISGFQVLQQQGIEADDFIAQYVKNCTKGEKVFVRSSDDDLFQILRIGVTLLRQKNKPYTLRDFNRTYDFGVKKWPLFTTLKGGHNNLKGIPKIGPKTAAKILMDDQKYEEVYTKHKEYIDEVIRLNILPINPLTIPEHTPQKFKNRAYTRFLDKLGIDPAFNLVDPFVNFSM